MNKQKEYTIGYDIGSPEGLDCAVIAEKLPDGTINIVDVKYRDSKAKDDEIVEYMEVSGLDKDFQKILEAHRKQLEEVCGVKEEDWGTITRAKRKKDTV